MSNTLVVKQFTKFLFPFRYSRKETKLNDIVVRNDKGKELPLFLPFSPKSESLRKGLDDLLSIDGGSAKIADCYELNYNCRALFGLPQRATDSLSFRSRPAENPLYAITVESVKLYLFESEVGFAEIEARYLTDKIEDCAECNYFLSETKSDRNILFFDSKINKDKSEKHSFTFKQLLQKTLSYVGGVYDIRKDEFPEFSEDKATIYSYMLTDSRPENLENVLFTLRRNYKGSYKFPNDKAIDTETRIKQQFDNSYWTTSVNGAVNLSFLTDDNTTNNFFETNFYSKLHDTYYTLFLHTIHQRFALMKYIGDMGMLDTLENNYIIMKKELKAAEDYYAKAANLKFRAFFRLPSNIEHVNDYFNLLQRTFNIRELKMSFDADLESLTNICKTYVKRIKQRDEKLISRRKKKVEIFVSLLGTLVAVITLLNSYWELLEKLLGNTINFWSIHIVVFIGALLVPLSTVIVDVVYNVKDIKKMTKDLNNEVADNLVEPDRLRRQRKRQVKIQRKNTDIETKE